MKNIAALVAIAGFAFVLAGCNTIEGIGKDVKAGGDKVEKEAQKAKSY
jgi:predicted small secreted protein